MCDKRKTNIAICGVGNGAHVLAGLASMVGDFEVAVLALQQDTAERWTGAAYKDGFKVNLPDSHYIHQPAGLVRFTVTKDASIMLSADIVVICAPAFRHHFYIKTIAPLLPESSLVVGMPGQPGFEFQCKKIFEENGKRCNVMSLSTLPWACRINIFGQEVSVVGTKNEVEFSHVDERKYRNPFGTPANVQRMLGDKPVLKQVSVIHLTLASKVSFNPPLMFSKWRHWDGTPLPFPPLFFQGVDEEAVKCLEAVTKEVLGIARAIERKFPSVDLSGLLTMKQWLISMYGNKIKDQTSLLSCLQTNDAYCGLYHPLVKVIDDKYLPDFTHRFITEDVPYGLVVLRQMAEFVDVKTPSMDEVVEWALTKLDQVFLIDGKISGGDRKTNRLPISYGINSIEDFVQYFEVSDDKN